jgi:chromatin remodeling complex protein RSC6
VGVHQKNNHQNPENKREILADDKLQAVFGGKSKVSMFEMNCVAPSFVFEGAPASGASPRPVGGSLRKPAEGLLRH